jgi:hypothetical protein
MASPPSTISHHLLSEKLLEILCCYSQTIYERKRPLRSVSNNDDAVHVLDKSKASAMYEKRGEASKLGRCEVRGMGRNDDDSPTLNIVLYSYE